MAISSEILALFGVFDLSLLGLFDLSLLGLFDLSLLGLFDLSLRDLLGLFGGLNMDSHSKDRILKPYTVLDRTSWRRSLGSA